MFDLEKALAAWRQFHARRRVFLPEDLDELERHLRDHTAHLVARGAEEEAAFRTAVQALGDLHDGEAEYGKVYWGKLRRRHALIHELRNSVTMWQNYLKIAWRNMRRHKGYTCINITGLAVGLACSFLILLWVRDELRHDRFLDDGDRIHRVWRNVTVGGQVYTWGDTARPLADVLATAYPEIERVAHTYQPQRFVVTADGQHFRENGTYASEGFFDVFAFPFLLGDPATALQGDAAVVITARTARKLFGDDWRARGDVLGRPLTIDHRKDFTITGVIENLPDHSSLQFDVLLPIQDFFARNAWTDDWHSNAFPLFVKLHEGASPEAVSRQIAGVVSTHAEGADEVLFLQAFEEMYLYSTFQDGRLVGGRIEYVRMFSMVAVFLLLIAAINFMNLATARSAGRAREIGVRKAVGAHRPSLVGQFLGEALLVALVAFGCALALALALLPFFNELTGKHLTAADLDGGLLLAGLGVTLVVGLLAGSYPALYLSSFSPLSVLRGTFRQRPGAAYLRKGLVVFQFGLSVLLIAGTAAAYLQVEYIRTRDLGMSRENLIHVAQEGALHSQYEAVRRELLQQPGIAAVTAASTNPLSIGSSTGSVRWAGKDPDDERETYLIRASYDFIETMQMEVVAGRPFSRAFGADDPGYVINETMARWLGGDDVVGRRISFWDQSGVVIGVVKDFDMNSLYNPIEPVLITLTPERTSRLYVRTEPGETQAALAGLQAVFEQFSPEYPFEYGFLDEAFEATYRSEVVMGQLANVFAVLAVFLSCLGLFGLASFTTEQRTKEIGVRKVLGASVPRLVMLLTGEVTRLVLLGIVLAVPVAYYAVDVWLARFTAHVEIGIGLYAAAGAAAVALAWLTVSYQSVRAALADPVRSLRYE